MGGEIREEGTEQRETEQRDASVRIRAEESERKDPRGGI